MKKISLFSVFCILFSLTSCNNISIPSNGESINNETSSNLSSESNDVESLSSEVITNLDSINVPTIEETIGWDENKINYINPKPSLKQIDYNSRYVDFSTFNGNQKDEITGLLEDYIMQNNLNGIVLSNNGYYAKYSDRVEFPTTKLLDVEGNPILYNDTIRYKYIYNYGFGIIEEGTLNDINKQNVNYPSYYQDFLYEDNKTLNLFNSNVDYLNYNKNYLFSSFFSKKLNKSKDGYEWFPSLATKDNNVNGLFRPIPLDDSYNKINNANDDTLSKNYRIYVNTNEEGLTYNTLTQIEKFVQYKGRQVLLEDYLTPFKHLFNQANNFNNAINYLNGKVCIDGLKEYYELTKDGFNQSAWENVGIKPGMENGNAFLDISFENEVNPYDAMINLSQNIFTPIPQDFIDVIGGIHNYGNFVGRDYTPVDTTLSVGPYVVESWKKNKEIIFKRNDLITYEIKGGEGRYQIPGIRLVISDDPYSLWEKGLIDYYPITNDKLDLINSKGTQLIDGNITNSLKINTCNQGNWETLFGENGKIYKNKKEDYWFNAPAMSNKNFIKGLNLSINRMEYGKINGVIPSISYFTNAYKNDYRSNYSYNDTNYHNNALLNYYGDVNIINNFGYDLKEARKYFSLACEELLSSGDYMYGDTIKIEISWSSKSQSDSTGKLIENYLESAFNDISVFNNNLKLDIKNVYTKNYEDNFIKMFTGQYNICSEGITSTSYNPLELLELAKCKYKTFNYSIDTNSSENLINYMDSCYTFDSLLDATLKGTYINESWENATLFDATIISNTLNSDGSRTIIIKYDLDSSIVSINNVKLCINDKAIYTNISNENKTITVNIDKETISNNIGDISISIYYIDNLNNAYINTLNTYNNI